MKIKVIDIEWDTDGDEEVLAALPTEIVVDFADIDWLDGTPDDVTEENSNDIADYLSDQYGFCVNGFDYQTL
jgi:hypothetical protein